MVNKYKYYCEIHGWQEVISDSEPTACHINSLDRARAIELIESDVKIKGANSLGSNISLSDYKQLRHNEIDYKTSVLISTGFTYDSSLFSTSTNAQINWSSIKDSTTDYTFPLLISTKDNNEYSLIEANVIAFWTVGRDFVKGHIDSGRSLKKSIFDAVDEAAVDAIIDNR